MKEKLDTKQYFERKSTMSNMKNLILILALCTVASATTFAQPGGGRPDKPRNQENRPQLLIPDSAQTVKLVDELASELSLSEDVKIEVLKLYLSHFSAVKNLEESSKDDQKSLRSKKDSLRKELQDEMKKLLSDEQYKKYKNYMKKQNPRPERPKRGR